MKNELNSFSWECEDTVGIHYIATDSEDIEDAVCTEVRSGERELVIAIQLLVAVSCKSSINQIINPSPDSSY